MSATIELAVGKLDELSDPGCRGVQIGDGTVGPVTRAFFDAFLEETGSGS